MRQSQWYENDQPDPVMRSRSRVRCTR
jgi:hypothetical protein